MHGLLGVLKGIAHQVHVQVGTVTPIICVWSQKWHMTYADQFIKKIRTKGS